MFSNAKHLILATGLGLGLSSAAWAGDIVDTASKSGNFNTLVKAVKAAGLVDTLKGPGPFTVFAPTDAAFAKLPAGKLDGLLKDPEKLKSILTYHVVAGKVSAAEVKPGDVKTVNGQSLKVAMSGGKVKVDQAYVITKDVKADNGVIHAIDTVVMPK